MHNFFSDETEGNFNKSMQNLGMELVTDRGEMLKILSQSKDEGRAVGIYAPVLGEEIFVTAVEDIIIDEDITIVLKSYDMTGYMLETNKIRFSDITSVCPFKSAFKNPYMRTVKQSRSL